MKTSSLFRLLTIAGFSIAILLPGFHGPATAQEPKVSICDNQKCGLCYEYSGEWWVVEWEKGDCARNPGGVYKNTPCPSENLVGYCTYRPDDDPEKTIIFYYYKPVYTEQSARKACPGTNFKAWNK